MVQSDKPFVVVHGNCEFLWKSVKPVLEDLRDTKCNRLKDGTHFFCPQRNPLRFQSDF